MLESGQAAVPCLTENADLWFSDSPGEVEHAKRLYHDCPVRHICLAGARERREVAGVWPARGARIQAEFWASIR